MVLATGQASCWRNHLEARPSRTAPELLQSPLINMEEISTLLSSYQLQDLSRRCVAGG
jgi:hypothetical protein